MQARQTAYAERLPIAACRAGEGPGLLTGWLPGGQDEIETDPHAPRLIDTVSGAGSRLAVTRDRPSDRAAMARVDQAALG